MAVAIEALQLAKQYNRKEAVKDLTFQIRPGEIFGLLGPNGAGKTTTIKLLTGLISPTRGSVSIENGRYTPASREYRRRLGVTFTGSLYDRLTARENLNFFASLYPGRQTDGLEELLDLVELTGTGRKPVKAFSRGMRQRLELSRVLVNKPDYLFLDEPTLGLDPVGARRLRRVIKEINRRGVTVILTTHYMEEADELCGRIGILDQGRLVAFDTPAILKERYGQGQWIVEYRENGRNLSRTYSREEQGQLGKLFQEGRVVSIRSGEASLEEVYIKLTGRGLIT